MGGLTLDELVAVGSLLQLVLEIVGSLLAGEFLAGGLESPAEVSWGAVKGAELYVG